MIRALISAAVLLCLSANARAQDAQDACGTGASNGEATGCDKTSSAAKVAEVFPSDPAGVAEAGSVGPATPRTSVAVADDTWFELHGYARMPVSVQGTPRSPFLIDNDSFLSGFAYTRLYEPDWSEIFLSAHHKNFRVKFGLFASLYSDYASPELENQFGIAQASVAAEKFLGFDELSVEFGVFWDRFGFIEPYDTYVFGRTHQGGLKTRWDFNDDAYLQFGAGAHQEQLQQNQGLTPVVHLAGGSAIPGLKDLVLGGYVIRTWTRDKRQLSPIEDGGLTVYGVDARYQLPAKMGKVYTAVSHARAKSALFLAPALELLHSTGGRGITENYLGLNSSGNGTGSLSTLAVDAPISITPSLDTRVFGMMTWVRSEQVDEMDAELNKDRRMYLKWGVEPGYLVSKRGVRVALRYDRVILDMYDRENSFRVVSPKVSFPLDAWGELSLMYSRYIYGDKIQLRPGQVPLVTDPDKNVFKVQAQAVW